MEVRLSTKNVSRWAIALHNKGHFFPGYSSYYGSMDTFPKNTSMVLMYDIKRTDVNFIDNENGRCNQTVHGN
jgi:hypothetical protein